MNDEKNFDIQDLKRNKLIKIKINKFFSDYFNWLVFGIVLIILLFGFFLVLKPVYDQGMSVISILNQRDVVNFENKKQELNSIKELLASYNEISDKYKDKIESIAPVRKNKEEIFSEINHLAYQNGLLLQGISLSESEGPSIVPGVETITVNFSVRGTDYEAFKNFLSAMENNLPLLDVLSLSFSPDGKTSSFVVDTYYIKEKSNDNT